MGQLKNYNRFEAVSGSLEQVQREVNTLENLLNIHPFPKFKHVVKYLNENDTPG